MIKVLLADDESMAIEDTLRMVDWGANGCEVVATANNGRAAWELYQKHRPQIVIADICMPVLDGLGLSEKISQAGGNTVIFLLTSHENFQYAQKAIHAGVARYLLKHEMTPEILERELALARSQLAERAQADLLQKQHGLQRLLSGAASAEEYGKFGPADTFWLLVMAQRRVCWPPVEDEAPYISEDMREQLLAQATAEPFALLVPEDGTLAFFVPLPAGRAAAEAAALPAAEDVRRFLRENGLRPSLFYQPFALVPGAAARVYARWQEVAKYAIFEPRNREVQPVFSLAELAEKSTHNEPPADFYRPGLEDGVRLAVENRDRAALAEKLHGLFTLNSRIPWRYNVAIWMLRRLDNVRQELNRSLRPDAPQDGTPFLGSHWHTLEEAEQWFLTRLGAALEERDKAANSDYSRSLTQAMQYIQQHYDGDLSLDTVAAAAGISGVYLSQLFTKETGQTFVEYLTGYRIETSKRLLAAGSYRINKIAKMVGFNSSQYFSQVFRKSTGLSPQDYRESL